MQRNFSDPQYIAWRKKTLIRDKYTCQFPGCNSKKRPNVHHIRCWSEYPMLRFDPQNGIVLCCECHNRVRGKEGQYVELFTNIIMQKYGNKDTYLQILKDLYLDDKDE